MTTDEWYLFLLSYFYPIFFISCIFLQSVLFYTIFFHSPKNMSRMRYFIGNTCICQIILVSSTCFGQFRAVSDKVPVEFRAYGPVRHFPAIVGFTFTEIVQLGLMISHLSIVTTLYLKFEAVRSLDLKSKKITFMICLIQSPSLVSLIAESTTVIVTQLPEERQQYYAAVNKNTTQYSVIGSGLQTLSSSINVSLYVVMSLLAPIVCFFLRRSILAHINMHLNRSSHMNNLHHRLFVKGLTIQVVLPLFCFVPILVIYFYCIVTHEVILFNQYFMYLAPAFSSFFDPLVALWFVAPYRKKIKTWLHLDKTSIVAVAPESTGS